MNETNVETNTNEAALAAANEAHAAPTNPETAGEAAETRAERPQLREVTAADALETLRTTGRLANARVRGLVLSGEFTEPIEMHHVTLIRARFEKAQFRAPVRLFGCEFVRWQVKKCEFEAGLDLAGSQMDGLTLTKSTFGDKFRADNAEFRRQLRVQGTTFKNVRFWQAHFACWANFEGCTFEGVADFRSFHADEGVSFQDGVFEQDFLMRGATVSKKLAFDGSRFDALLDLSKAKLHDFVYLEDIRQGPEQRFAIANVVAERVLVQPEQIEGRLQSEEQGDYELAKQAYGFLKRNFESLHRFEDEDWAFYQFKVSHRLSRPSSWSRPWTAIARWSEYLLLDLGCGYGTNPFRAVLTALLLIVAFGGLFALGIEHFNVEFPPVAGQPATSVANRLAYGMMTSVSVFTAGFTGEYLNVARGWVLVPLTIEALLGTLLWGLFIVAFSRKVIR